MNKNTNYQSESHEAALSIAVFFFCLLGFFFLCLNPSETATQSQFFIGLLGSKAAMLACWAVAAKCYRKLYC